VFSKSANPLDLRQKSTIRALFKAKSVDPKTYSPPSKSKHDPVLATAAQGCESHHIKVSATFAIQSITWPDIPAQLISAVTYHLGFAIFPVEK